MPMKTLHAFPDSGHHILFLPLYAPDPAGIAELEALDAVSEDRAKWIRERAAKSDWTSPSGMPWLLGRFGTDRYVSETGREIEVFGFWCAVETNLGDRGRGYLRLKSRETGRDRQDRAVRPADTGSPGARPPASSAATPINGTAYIARLEDDLGERLTIDLGAKFGFSDLFPDVTFECVWLQEAGKPIPVDLIVDFGNSRTVALALEQSVSDQGFTSICKPIQFPNPGSDVESLDYDVTNFDEVIPDSWFTLIEPVFPPNRTHDTTVELAPPPDRSAKGLRKLAARNTRPARENVTITPHMFREISPAVFGPAARTALSSLDVEGGGLSFLSSPKRYVWDDKPMGESGRTHWTMNQQPWRIGPQEKNRLLPLNGEISRFMPNANASWSIESWPFLEAGDYDMRPDHSRADSLVWVALSIIEQAARQIQSETWRRGNQPFLRRELGNILLTYPSGWTEDEIEVFRSKWLMARNIFSVSRMEKPNGEVVDHKLPGVNLELDEAVASQLAIVYSEMRHMRDYGENWIKLFGQHREGAETVRAMTIDIGGGTTDTSIVEYSDGQPGVGVDLTATLMFKDATIVAGDRLVSDIVERVLLPSIGQRFAGSPDQKAAFEKLFFARAKRDGERAQWSVIARTVIIPIVHQWLRCFVNEEKLNPKTGKGWTPAEAGASRVQIERLNVLSEAAGLPGTLLEPDTPLTPDFGAIRRAIHDWFLHIADTHARYLAAFNCDLVILTGKPSELPEIRELLERRLPIAPNRIISAKGYYAGDWLPMSGDGRIGDAKLVTALGLAVYRGVQAGLISGWRIKGKVHETYRVQNYWGRIAGNLKPFLKGDVLLSANEEEADVRLLTDSLIGRARFLNHVLPEQVYRLTMKAREQRLVDVRLRRIITKPQEGRYPTSAEALQLVSAKDAQTGKPIPLTDIRLQLCTMPRAEEHWQDSGRFEVRWTL